MAKEGTGFPIKITWGGTQICAKSKKLVKFTADDPVDVSTDCIDNGLREFLPGDLYKIEGVEVTTPLDFDKAETFRVAMRDKTIDAMVITSEYTNKGYSIPGAFVTGVDLGTADIGSAAEMTITFSFTGGANGEPVLTV